MEERLSKYGEPFLTLVFTTAFNWTYPTLLLGAFIWHAISWDSLQTQDSGLFGTSNKQFLPFLQKIFQTKKWNYNGTVFSITVFSNYSILIYAISTVWGIFTKSIPTTISILLSSLQYFAVKLLMYLIYTVF